MKRSRVNQPLSAGVEKTMARYAFAAAGIASVAAAANAKADFSGPYAPANWTLQNTGGSDGIVDTSTAPASITLIGGDSGSSSSGTTDFTIAVVASGTVSFDWTYSSFDSGVYDVANFLLNGAPILLSTNATQGSDSFTTPVTAGDVIGFEVFSLDNTEGPGVLGVSNFVAPVPEPATLSLLALGAAGVTILQRRRSQLQAPK